MIRRINAVIRLFRRRGAYDPYEVDCKRSLADPRCGLPDKYGWNCCRYWS